MGREKKEYEKITVNLKKEISVMLKAISGETGLTKTAVIERAVAAYHKAYQKTGRI